MEILNLYSKAKMGKIDEKTQEIRLLDIFVLSPFMIWFGATATGVPQWAKFVMVISGILTALYNGRNYLRKKKK